MIRVAQIIDSLNMGGAEQLMSLLVEESSERDIEMHIISLSNGADATLLKRLKAAGGRISTMPAMKVLAPLRMGRLIVFLRSKKIDLVQTHLSTANIVGALASQFAGVKVVSTLHSVDIDPAYYKPMRYKLEEQALRYVADRVVAVGPAVAKAHQQRLHRKIDVIPNAVAPLSPVGPGDVSKIRARIHIDPHIPLLISVGRLAPPKAFDILIQAFSIVHPWHPSAKLIIVGDGILKNRLEEQIVRLDLQNSIFLLGKRDDVPELLAASNVYVASSLWEGMPLSILEAMSVGLPVVATSVGDIPNVLTEDQGSVVPPGDAPLLAAAIRKIMDDPFAGKLMGRVARDYILRHHSPSAWMDRLMNLYNEVLYPSAVKKAV